MAAPTGLFVEIAKGLGEDGTSLLARSLPLNPSEDWTAVSLPFETPATDDPIVVRIVRRPVGRLYDFISGSVWFDEFAVESVSAANSPATISRVKGGVSTSEVTYGDAHGHR
jgi:hypothetical protein